MGIFRTKLYPASIYIFTLFLSITILGIAMIHYQSVIPSSFSSPEDVSHDFYYETSGGKVLAETFASTYTVKPGMTYYLNTTLPHNLADTYSLQFFTENSWVSVYVNDTVIYKVSPEQFLNADTSPGSFWNFVTVPEWAYGKTLSIKLTPVYHETSSFIHKIYQGSLYELLHNFIRERILPVSLSLINLFISLTLLVFGILGRKNKLMRSMLFLGLFGLLVSIHSLYETDIISFFFANKQLLQQLNYMLYALTPFPFLHHCILENKILPSRKRLLLESVPIINFMLVLFMHLTGSLDFYDSSIFTSITVLFTIIVILSYCGQSLIQDKLIKLRPNINLLGIFLFIISLLAELIGYYMNPTNDSSIVTRITLLLYLLFYLYHYGKRAMSLVHIGLHSENLKETAFLDPLTGLGNRTALNNAMETFEKNLIHIKSIGIIQFDINFLKRVNDTFGHLTGDRLIKNAANAILKGFKEYGKCYRFGGDEFVVILIGNAKEKYSFGIQILERYLEQINTRLPKDEQVSLAYGVAYYDSSIDANLWRVQERADATMYERKRQVKEKLNSNYSDSRL